MYRSFDRELASHCSPALAGIKPANLLCCRLERYRGFDDMISQYNTSFAAKGIRFEPLCRCPKSCLLLVYRQSVLARQLAGNEVRALLGEAGYFPHEIGLFLGYPPGDVTAFVQQRGRGYKLCGHWKVYSNEQAAQKLFQRYDRCRGAVCERLSRGMSISQLFGAA